MKKKKRNNNKIMKGIKQVKEYHFIKRIGKGVTATVYEGINEKTNKVVAIKAIPSEKLSDSRSMENTIKKRTAAN